VRIRRRVATWWDAAGTEYRDEHVTRVHDNPDHIPGTRLVDVYGPCGHLLAVVVRSRMPLLWGLPNLGPTAALEGEHWRYTMIADGSVGLLGSPRDDVELSCQDCGNRASLLPAAAVARAVAGRKGRRAARVETILDAHR